MKQKYYRIHTLNGIVADYKLEGLGGILKEKGATIKERQDPSSGIEHITYEIGNSKLEIERIQKAEGRLISFDTEIFASITGPNKELENAFKRIFNNKKINWTEKIFSD